MYNHVVQSHHDKKEITKQSMHSSQSIWMSHWSRTSYKMEPPQSHQPVNRTINITDIGKDVAAMPRYSRNETLPLDRDGMLTVNDNRATVDYGQSMGPSIHSKTGLEIVSSVRKENLLIWNPPAGEAQERETNINDADMSHDLKWQIKSNLLLSSCKHATDGTNYHENAFGEHAGSISGLAGKRNLRNTNRLTELVSNKINFQGGSALFAHQQNSVHPYVPKTQTNNIGLGMDSPSTSKNRLSFFVDGKCQKSHDHLSSKLPRSEDECFEFEYPSYNREISGNTSQVFFTKKNDLEPCRSSQYSGSRFGEFLSLAERAFQKPQGLKLQPLWSSTDSEENGKTCINNSSTTKNEASAETETMDMDIFNGDASSASDKELGGSLKLQISQAAEASTREAGDDNRNGVNVNPALPAVSRFTDGADSSKTLSLDLGRLLPYGFQTTDSKYKSGFSSGSGLKPESRWVKRLKTDSLSHYHGTKSLKMEEIVTIDPQEKINSSFGKPMKPGSELHDKERTEFLEQSRVLLRDGNSSSNESMERSGKDLVSDSWIRRWCRNQTPLQKKHIDLSSSSRLIEPKSLKASFDDLRKKQFPSVAAMALMGKAMNGFQECEFSKRGSFVVWNTKGF